MAPVSWSDLPARFAHAAGCGGLSAESAVASIHWCSLHALMKAPLMEAPPTVSSYPARFTVDDVNGESLRLDSEISSMLRSPTLRARLDELAAVQY